MSPNTGGKFSNSVADYEKSDDKFESSKPEWNCWEHILWINVFWFVGLHFGALYGAYLALACASWKTTLFAFVTHKVSLFGITGGVHRLWSHKSYKAKLPLRIFLGFCNSVAYQNSIYDWARDHRVHHKFTETDADPHNAKRGFFFSHMGWLCCKKHPDVKAMGAKIDLSDLLSDPVVYYQKKFYPWLVVLCCFVFPTAIPYYFWNETAWNAFFVAVVFRYCASLHTTWLVNSAAHMYGDKPYDKDIAAAENFTVATFALGEGFHNFHHTFPWDYCTSEWGWRLNLTTMLLDIFAKVGLAYDLRKVSPEMIKSRINRTGESILKAL